jgi:hypothetical protein
MKTVVKPKVLISYTWRPDDPSDPNDKPKARGLDLANRLRATGLDCRIDQYFLLARYGFVRPHSRADDKVADPWVMWAEEQVRDGDFVLLVCSAQYAANVCKSPLGGDLTWEQWRSMPEDWKFKLQKFQMDETEGKKDKIPYAWWDWHFMIQDIESGRAERQKFIPVGFGPYSSISQYVPPFIKGATYYNLTLSEELDGLLQSIRTEFRILHPRAGVFISYSHKDEKWLNSLVEHLAFLTQQGVAIWTDREIEPGDRWREEIEDALATARVAVLLVTPAFLASPFIQNNELPTLLRAASSEGLVIFWIPVEPSSYNQYDIRDFQAAITASKPLSQLKRAQRDQAFVSIASKLAQRLGVNRP